MKGIAGILLVLVCQTVFCQSKDIEVIKKLNKDWINSYPTKDTVMLSRIFANDFALINHRGTKMTRKDILDNLHKQEITSAHIDSVEVKLLTKDVGVVTAYTTFVFNADGKKMTGKNCYQDIYVKRKEKWVAVNAHVTLLDIQ
jgi:uncharacterized protein (TIGR02246 family)